jgi:hypothetical protein
MGGLVIDIFVAFVVRWAIVFGCRAASRDWPTVSGTVVRCHLEKPGFGCMYVAVQYKYKFSSERHDGVLNKPYFSATNDAEAYVRHHPGGSQLTVRVDPKNPTRSFPVLD